MKYKNVEHIPVWKDGIPLTVKVFVATKDAAFRGQGDIANQIQRAALLVPNNIAEGFEQETTPELLQFLYDVKGLAGDVRSISHVIERLSAFNHLKSGILDLKSLARSISRQLAGWAFSLQELDIKGMRHLTKKSKATYHQKDRAQVFIADLKKQHEARLEDLKRERGCRSVFRG